MSNAFQIANDSIFSDSNIGEVATYTTGGVDSAVQVVSHKPDENFGIDGAGYSEQVIFEVRFSDIASPESGDKLTVNGIVYKINHDNCRKDTQALSWILDVEEE